MNVQVLSLSGLLANAEIIILLIGLGFIVLFIRTLMDILRFPFKNSDSKLVWAVCLFIFCIPTMLIWWVGKSSR